MKPLLGAIGGLALAFAANVAMAEAVNFPAAPVKPTPFALRRAELQGSPIQVQPGDMIAGDLYRPDGPGPFPAIISLHGCLGWPRTAELRAHQAAKYTSQGYLFLAVDSYGPRGLRQTCVPTPGSQPADRLGDAQGALDWIGAQTSVDPLRVALMGASQGGTIVLTALGKDQGATPGGRRFAAGVAFYPTCSPASAVVSAPLLVIVGALDDWAPTSDCLAMSAATHDGGSPETVLVLPGAHHSFDVESLRGRPQDVFGHHLEFDAAATEKANAAVASFLKAALGPKS